MCPQLALHKHREFIAVLVGVPHHPSGHVAIVDV